MSVFECKKLLNIMAEKRKHAPDGIKLTCILKTMSKINMLATA